MVKCKYLTLFLKFFQSNRCHCGKKGCTGPFKYFFFLDSGVFSMLNYLLILSLYSWVSLSSKLLSIFM